MSDRVLRAILIGWSILLLGVGLILVAELPYSDVFGRGEEGMGSSRRCGAGERRSALCWRPDG